MTGGPVHFLHIGKTGGTALGNAVRAADPETDLILHGHAVTLADIPEGQRVFFFLRDPVTRFSSAFYSRLREGRPMTYRPWKPEEALAFGLYQTPSALAEDLDSPDAGAREAARAAMRGIGHVRSSFYDWVIDDDYFQSRLDDIAFIGFQETFETDLHHLQAEGLIPAGATPPTDDVQAHRTPPRFDRTLSDDAVRAVRDWYARDIGFYNRCALLRASRWPNLPRPSALPPA